MRTGTGSSVAVQGNKQNKDDIPYKRFQQALNAAGEYVHSSMIYTFARQALGYARITDIVHAVVGGRVHLTTSRMLPLSMPLHLALTAGVTVLGMQAVDCLGRHLGTGGLAGAAHAGKQITWPTRPVAIWLRSAVTMPRWATTSSNRWGRHLRYRARYPLLPFQQKTGQRLTGV